MHALQISVQWNVLPKLGRVTVISQILTKITRTLGLLYTFKVQQITTSGENLLFFFFGQWQQYHQNTPLRPIVKMHFYREGTAPTVQTIYLFPSITSRPQPKPSGSTHASPIIAARCTPLDRVVHGCCCPISCHVLQLAMCNVLLCGPPP